MQKNQIILTGIVACGATLLTLASTHIFSHPNTEIGIPSANFIPTNYSAGAAGGIDFQQASALAIPAVVHINTATAGRTVSSPFYDPFDMFGGQQQMYAPPTRGSGSGVIIASDGYIVTNNHVVKDADKLRVTLANQKEYDAKVVGTDPATDLAVIKIEADHLPTLAFGNSDAVNIGQWVLAAGYPLNLDATVTAGIVSAKSRNLNINQRNSSTSIESFIQTDAAVNQGNSGGALVNLAGELIGINSAIASPTGSYAGYSYAIPSNIVQKVVNDIIKYGEAKRGYIGIYYEPINPTVNEKYNLASNEKGIRINEVISSGAAAKAGLQEGDIIYKVGDKVINNDNEFKEKISTLTLNQPVEIVFKRNGNVMTSSLIPSDKIGNSKKASAANRPSEMGRPNTPTRNGNWFDNIELQKLSAADCQQLQIESGVKMKFKSNENPFGGMVRDGFIITSVNGEKIKSAEEVLEKAKANEGIELGGTYPNQRGNFYIKIK